MTCLDPIQSTARTVPCPSFIEKHALWPIIGSVRNRPEIIPKSGADGFSVCFGLTNECNLAYRPITIAIPVAIACPSMTSSAFAKVCRFDR
jgi:hypothetical protein